MSHFSEQMQRTHGSALPAALMVTGLIVAGLTGGMFYFDSLNKSLQRTNLQQVIQHLRENLIATLDSDAAWIATLAANPRLNCLLPPSGWTPNPNGAPTQTGVTCLPDQFGPIKVTNGDGSVVTDPDSTRSGFNYRGEPCNTFGEEGTQCDFRLIVSWSCDGACAPTTYQLGALIPGSPRLKLEGALEISPHSPLGSRDINLASHGFQISRGTVDRTLAKFCESMNGVFNQKDSRCESLLSEFGDFDCSAAPPAGLGPGGFLAGFTQMSIAGQDVLVPQCEKTRMYGETCSSTTAVTEIGFRGNLGCGTF